MSYTTITQSTRDDALLDRLRAAVAKETFANEAFGNTPTGGVVQQAGPDAVLAQFVWPCCIDFEADYSYAIDGANENPGGDPGVIGDDEIQSAVQVHWPDPQWVEPPPPEPPVIDNTLPEPQ